MRAQLSIGIMVGLCCSATYAAAPVAPAGAPADGEVAGWVDQKVAECSPKPEERRFDQTGWLTDIRSALELAKRHNRPVFLFTHDGRMGLGRC
jgi:phosphate-selective porin